MTRYGNSPNDVKYLNVNLSEDVENAFNDINTALLELF